MKKLGKPLPPVIDVPPPTQDEINIIIAKWNANCPPAYVGLMEAQLITEPNPTAKFLYDKAKMIYIHRKTGAVLTRKEVNEAFLYFSDRMSKQ